MKTPRFLRGLLGAVLGWLIGAGGMVIILGLVLQVRWIVVLVVLGGATVACVPIFLRSYREGGW